MQDSRGITLRKNDNVCYVYQKNRSYAHMLYGTILKFDKRYVYVKLEHNDVIVRKLSSSLTKIPKIKKVGNVNE